MPARDRPELRRGKFGAEFSPNGCSVNKRTSHFLRQAVETESVAAEARGKKRREACLFVGAELGGQSVVFLDNRAGRYSSQFTDNNKVRLEDL